MLFPIYHPKVKRPLIKKISGVEHGEELKNDQFGRKNSRKKRKISEKNRDLDGCRLIGVA
tara:strand:+ start:73 stop:252 length:180 start_codon:yes stop_codon:yes gene_type:complete